MVIAPAAALVPLELPVDVVVGATAGVGGCRLGGGALAPPAIINAQAELVAASMVRFIVPRESSANLNVGLRVAVREATREIRGRAQHLRRR